MSKSVMVVILFCSLLLAFQNCSGVGSPNVTFESVGLDAQEVPVVPNIDSNNIDESLPEDFPEEFSEYIPQDVPEEVFELPPPEPETGVYEGFMTHPKKRRFIRTVGISYGEALDNCKENARLNPNDGIYCTYNGELIFRASEASHSPPSNPPFSPPSSGSGTYIGYFMTPSPRMFIRTVGISKAEALSNCKLNASKNPSHHVKCTYDGVKIYESN